MKNSKAGERKTHVQSGLKTVKGVRNIAEKKRTRNEENTSPCGPRITLKKSNPARTSQ